MALTSIADQKTPGRPIEITFAAETGLPSANQEILIFGHMVEAGAASGNAVPYTVYNIANSASVSAASGEISPKFGATSELTNMVLSAIRANAGGSTFPALKVIPLAEADVDWGALDVALTNAQNQKAEFIVSPYDGMDLTLTDKLVEHCRLVSGATRTDNNQFGSIGVAFNRSVTDPTTLFSYDTQFLNGVWMPDTGTSGNAPAYSLGEMASAYTAVVAANAIPFNPLNSQTIQNVAAPALMSDWITVGVGLESEAALVKGWTPLYVKANGEVAIVRTVTERLSADGTGSPIVTAYYDVQDFQVLYFFRKTLWTRFSQPDFKQRKASAGTAVEIKSEVIRLMQAFEDQGMFQAVTQLAKLVKVERSLSDRSRFDIFVPVNVVPGLHVIATNIQATTQFDVVTV